MNDYGAGSPNRGIRLGAYNLSHIMFIAFLLTASMNRISIYKNFTVPDFFLSLSFLFVITSFLIRGFFPINFFVHDNPIWAPGALFIFSCVMSTIAGPKIHLLNSILVIAQFAFIFFVMAPIFGFHFGKPERKTLHCAERVGVLILISGLFASLIAILREYTGISVLNAAVTRLGRHGSYMQGPGNFSHYLTMVWPFGLHFTLATRHFKRVLGIFSLVVLGVGVFLSAARFAFVAIPIVSCLYLACRAVYTKTGWRKLLYGCVLTLVLLGMVRLTYLFIENPELLRALIDSISITGAMEKKLSRFYVVFESGSLESFDPKRALSTSKTLEFIRSLRFLGIGLDNTEHVLGFRPHVLLLTVWIEAGLLALLSVLIIYYKVAKAALRNLINCRTYVGVGFVSALFASCVGSFLSGFQSPLSLQNRYQWVPYLTMLVLPWFRKNNTVLTSG